MELALPDPKRGARIRRGMVVGAAVTVTAALAVVAVAAFIRRPPPPYTARGVSVILATGAEARIDPQAPEARRAAGEVVAALTRPVRVVEPGRVAFDLVSPLGEPVAGVLVLRFEFDPPLDTPAGRVRMIRLNGQERSHRVALVTWEGGGGALVFLMPDVRFRHWRARRFARETNTVFGIGFRQLGVGRTSIQTPVAAPKSDDRPLPPNSSDWQ